jgi:hypothetical protein
MVAEVSLLKEHGVERIFYLQPGRFSTEHPNIVYLVYPTWVINKHKKAKSKKSF